MSQVQHHFFVQHGSSTRCQTINLANIPSIKALRSMIARLFFVADADGICFYNGPTVLLSLDEIKESSASVEVRINGASVRMPPGPKPLPYVGNHYELYPDPLGNFDRLFLRYGPIIRTVNMGTTVYFTNDPEVSRHVLRESAFFTKKVSDPSHPLYFMHNPECLFTCDSDALAFEISHKIIPPSMSPKAVRHYTPIVHGSVIKCYSVFDELDSRELAFNVYHYMFKLAGQVIWKVILGMDLDHFASVDAKPHETLRWLGEYLELLKKASLRPTWTRSLPFGITRRIEKVRTLLWDGVSKGIDDAAKGEGDLPLNEAALNATCVADYLLRATDKDGRKLPKELVLSNCVIMVGAGFVTTSSLLSWMIYAFVKYPGNQERLLQDIVDHGAGPDKEWTYDELHAMPFLDHFVKETQRMHNPSFQTARNAKEDVILPGGYMLPKGAVIIPTFPSMHKNPARWENPNRFDPDRWDTDGVKNRHKMAYTPFAAGTRGCIGQTLALLEAKAVIAKLAYRYHFEDACTEPVVYDPEFIVIRPVNFYARAVVRTRWPPRSSKAV